MTNILYGSQYLYRFGSGSNFIAYDAGTAMHWAMLSENNIVDIWFEKDGGTTAGAPVNAGDTVYLATNLSSGLLGRYLIIDARGYLRWDIIAGSLRGLWQVNSPGLNTGDSIPIYSNVTFQAADTGMSTNQWLAQESGKDYLQLSGTALTLASTDT